MSEAATKIEKPTARQVRDPELIAMHEIVEIIGDLSEDSQGRVVAWINDRWMNEKPPFNVE